MDSPIETLVRAGVRLKGSRRHGHFAMALVVTTFVLLLQAGLPAAEIPPYPYEAPDWLLALREKLKTQCTMKFDRIPLREAIEKVSSSTGVKIEIADDAEEAADKLIAPWSLRDAGAESFLRHLVSTSGLHYTLVKTGVLVTAEASKSPYAEAEEIGRKTESVRAGRFPNAEEKAERAARRASFKNQDLALEKFRKSLDSTKITRDFVDVPLQEVLKGLLEACKATFALTNEAWEKVRQGPSKLTVKGGSRSAKKVLEEVLLPYGLKYEHNVDDGGYWLIGLPEQCVAVRVGIMYTIIFPEERERGERKIFNQKITRDLKGSHVCDFVDALGEGLGLSVYPDSLSWKAEVKLPNKTAGMTVRQLASILKQKGVELVIEPSPFFHRTQTWTRGEPAPTKPPPEGPEVDWSIYLVQRGK